MRNNSFEQILDLYGSAYLTCCRVRPDTYRPENPEFEITTTPSSPSGYRGFTRAAAAAVLVAMIGLSIGSGYIGF